MLAKQLRLIITFVNTVDAMRMETVCKTLDKPGRLIPVPRAITAGCGLCYMADPEQKDSILTKMEKEKIIWQQVITMEL